MSVHDIAKIRVERIRIATLPDSAPQYVDCSLGADSAVILEGDDDSLKSSLETEGVQGEDGRYYLPSQGIAFMEALWTGYSLRNGYFKKIVFWKRGS